MAGLVARHRLPAVAEESLNALLAALAEESAAPTTVREPAAAAEAHLADSLAGLEVPGLAGAASIADVGAGAGFPGLALACALPGAAVDLIEATARKCTVIARLAAAAGLENARPVATRAEEWAAAEGAAAYDAVCARAVAPLAVLVEYAAPLLREGGELVAWKGARDRDQEEAAAAAAAALAMRAAEVRRVIPFPSARDRHLHVFVKEGPTPPGYPRRPGMARKRPLG